MTLSRSTCAHLKLGTVACMWDFQGLGGYKINYCHLVYYAGFKIFFPLKLCEMPQLLVITVFLFYI